MGAFFPIVSAFVIRRRTRFLSPRPIQNCAEKKLIKNENFKK
jgi:hypothetical protein